MCCLVHLILACGGCNRYKSNKVQGADPTTGETVALFNPRAQQVYPIKSRQIKKRVDVLCWALIEEGERIMATPSIQDIFSDIATLPADKLVELKQIIDFLRFTIKPTNSSQPANILSFAGSWKSMDEKTFHDLIDDISMRRQTGFSKRRANEASFD